MFLVRLSDPYIASMFFVMLSDPDTASMLQSP